MLLGTVFFEDDTYIFNNIEKSKEEELVNPIFQLF